VAVPAEFKTPLAAEKILRSATVVFWDFDGVIKDSVEVKSTAFEKLFLPYGAEIALRVRRHHEANGGISRFEKMPLYLSWAGLPVAGRRVQEFCNEFSVLVLQAVVDSPWVPGVREFLLSQHAQQYFVLVTATPQAEILQILDILGIGACFREIHGAPAKKSETIRGVLHRLHCDSDRALMVGDTDTDLVAASDNAVSFMLRRTSLNKALHSSHVGPMFDNLSHE
jgi:phosphoglycolate phosphatase-like HAD superfamily hydrolase